MMFLAAIFFLGQNIPIISDEDGMSSSQIAIIIACLVYVIRELLSYIKKLQDNKIQDENKNKFSGQNDRRKTDEISLAATLMMDQHEQIGKSLDHVATTLTNLNTHLTQQDGELTQIKAITKSTSGKATEVKEIVNQTKSDVESIDKKTDDIEKDTGLILDRIPRPSQ